MSTERRPRVLVTRPESADGPMCRALEREGCEAVLAPAFTIVAAETSPAPADLRDYDWVVWTSAAAVDVVGPGSDGPGRHAAVGGATAQALAAHGITPELVGDGGGAELAELLLENVEAGTRIVYPRSAKADRSFAERLRTFGIDVDDRIAYDVEPADPAPLQRALDTGVDAVVFASPTAVRGFVHAVGERFASGEGVILASIGPTTTGALRSHLREPDVVAAEPTFGALAAAVAEVLGRPVVEDEPA